MAKRKKLSFDEQRKLALERQKLLNRLTEGKMESLKEKVAFILNHYPDARDSNITLAIRFYQVFHPEEISNGWMRLESFYELPKMYDMQRERARIQNDYGLFLASENVRQRRMQLAEDARLEYGGSYDILPTLSIFSDESGKDQQYTVIGTVWFYNENRRIELENALKQWKKGRDCPEEFKFNELTYGILPLAKEFFTRTVPQTDSIGFKAVAIETQEAQLDHDKLVYRLYYETLMKGLEFELEHNRVRLPRIVFLSKDADSASDALWQAEFERKLNHDCSIFFDRQVQVEKIVPLDSKQHELLQIADLLTGSISRLLNRSSNTKKNQKDEFAEYVCEILSVDPASLEVSPGVDWVMTYIF
jgi:hypothetical protein